MKEIILNIILKKWTLELFLMLKFSIMGSMTKFWSFYLRGEKNHTAEKELIHYGLKMTLFTSVLKSCHSLFFRNVLSIIFLLFRTIYFSVQKMEKIAKNIGWWATMEHKLFKLHYHSLSITQKIKKLTGEWKSICYTNWSLIPAD